MTLCSSKASRDPDYEVDLIAMSDGRMRLTLLLRFSVADVVWKPEYQFVLQPIQVTETQMLLAKLQDANDKLDRFQSIFPVWVMKPSDCTTVSRNEAAAQIVVLKGAQSWLYLCGFVKPVMEYSGIDVKSAVERTTNTVHKPSDVVSQVLVYPLDATIDAVSHILLGQYAAHT
ncbi:unnamed protein product [Peronospora belbahrii]|uniref:Uncharacterized protein n=1 Tax=Peronospora belbahrii TaxID=622444 RepID=A0AAU9KUG5_9STRA|nr:unnamed protein product [Peronospora belbahrii]CAH0520125.1 unnamed protein product [Peronospora belbahrii]